MDELERITKNWIDANVWDGDDRVGANIWDDRVHFSPNDLQELIFELLPIIRNATLDEVESRVDTIHGDQGSESALGVLESVFEAIISMRGEYE